MTSLVDRLRKNVNSFQSSTAIIGQARQSLRDERNSSLNVFTDAVNKHLATEQDTLATPNDSQSRLRRQMATNKCHAHLSHLIGKQEQVANDAAKLIAEFQSVFSSAKVAMELAYQVNQINSLDSSKTDKMVLTNAVPYAYLSRRIATLQQAINLLSDVKAIAVEPVTGTMQCQHFDDLLQLFSSEKVLHKKLSQLISTGESLGVNFRLEDIRPIQSKQLVSNAGYDNVSCTAAFKSLGRLSSQLDSLYHHWFTDVPRYVTNAPNRITSCLQSLQEGNFAGDKCDKFVASKERCKRIDLALTLVTEVFYPMVLKEITSFTETLNELGAHKVIDDQATTGSTKSEFALDQTSGKHTEILQFIHGREVNPHRQFIQKGLSYASEQFGQLLGSLNTANLGLNDVHRDKLDLAKEGKNYTPDQLLAFVNGWKEYMGATSEYLKDLLDPSKPMANWDTFHIDGNRYADFEKTLDAVLLDKLDITVRKFNGALTSQIRYNSDLRNAVMLEDQVTYAGESYTSLDTAKQLKSALDKLTSESNQLYSRLSNLTEMVNNYPEECEVEDLQSFKLVYRTVAGLLQGVVYMNDDLNAIASMYH